MGFLRFSEIINLEIFDIILKEAHRSIFAEKKQNIYQNIYLCPLQFFRKYIDVAKDVRTIAPKENPPPVRVRVWFRVSVRDMQYRRGAVFLGANCLRTIAKIKESEKKFIFRKIYHNKEGFLIERP